MSRHDGVSCDFCMKNNFRGRRYKCLICFDYDLCAECYESNATSTRHTTDHAVQCILTRSMLEVAYGTGSSASSRQFQSFTCPYCGSKGFSDSTLLEHVTAEHSDGAMEVICPVCAASPGGEPNLKTDDLAEHLTLEHQRGGGGGGGGSGSGSTFEFINEPSAIRHGGVRRISRAAVGPGSVRSTRRSNSNFSPSNPDALADRESADLFAELQQTLAGGSRRQLQQLQMQIQMERQAIENRITNINRRATGTTGSSSSNTNQASISIQRILSAMSNSSGGGSSRTDSFLSSTPAVRSQLLSSVDTSTRGAPGSGTQTSSTGVAASQLSFIPAGIQLQGLATQQSQEGQSGGVTAASSCGGQLLMPRLVAPTMSEEDREQLERERADRSRFVQELLLATTHEISQIVINDASELTNETRVMQRDDDVEQVMAIRMDMESVGGGEEARAVAVDDHASSLSVEALKKGLMRKKETAEEAKKQKSKVPRK